MTDLVQTVFTGTTLNPDVSTAGVQVGAQSGAPMVTHVNAAGAADNRIYRQYATGTNYTFDVCNDAYNTCSHWLDMTRSGTTVSTLNLQATNVQINGSAIASATSATFTGTLTGFGSNPSCSMKYRKNGSTVTLFVASGTCSGTSNSTAMSLTGLPAATQPTTAVVTSCWVVDNSHTLLANCQINAAASQIDFGLADSTTNTGRVTAGGLFTASGTKALPTNWQMTYDLGN